MLQTKNVAIDDPPDLFSGPAGPPHGAFSEGGGPDRAPKLVQRTSFDGDGGGGFNNEEICHLVNLYRYPDGHAEMVMTRKRRERVEEPQEPQECVDPETGEILPYEVEKPPKTPEEVLQGLKKSAARARTTIRRAVMAGGLDHMVTFTFRRNELDINVAWHCFGRAVRILRDTLGEFQYVAVPERQKRGAWHIHCAARGKQDLDLLRRAWPHGAVNVTYRPDKPLHKLASYLSKYISKTFLGVEAAETGRERYRRAQGLNPEKITETVTIDPAHALAVMAALFRDRGLAGCGSVASGHSGQVDYFVWGCTWLEPPAPPL